MAHLFNITVKIFAKLALCATLLVALVPFALVGFVAIWADEGFMTAVVEVVDLYEQLLETMATYIVT